MQRPRHHQTRGAACTLLGTHQDPPPPACPTLCAQTPPSRRRTRLLSASGRNAPRAASSAQLSSAYVHAAITGTNRSGAFTSAAGGRYFWPPAIWRGGGHGGGDGACGEWGGEQVLKWERQRGVAGGAARLGESRHSQAHGRQGKDYKGWEKRTGLRLAHKKAFCVIAAAWQRLQIYYLKVHPRPGRHAMSRAHPPRRRSERPAHSMQGTCAVQRTQQHQAAPPHPPSLPGVHAAAASNRPPARAAGCRSTF